MYEKGVEILESMIRMPKRDIVYIHHKAGLEITGRTAP